MSDTPTPRTDEETHEWHFGFQSMEPSKFGGWVDADFARALERELAEAENNNTILKKCLLQMQEAAKQLADTRRELSEAREQLSDWQNAAKHVDADHPGEVHCGCVGILRKQLADARRQLTAAISQLANAIRERDNAMSDYRQADTDSIRALHERNEARAEAERLAAAIRRHRDAMQDTDETSVEDHILWNAITPSQP